MNIIFHTIGIIGHVRSSNALIIYRSLYDWLRKQGINVITEQKTANILTIKKGIIKRIIDIGKEAELAIIIGGDGNMLRAAHTLARYNIKIIGINLGNLGFLTDLDPESAIQDLALIVQGKFIQEKRFLIQAEIYKKNELQKSYIAINEIVFHSNKRTNMIKFEAFINNNFLFSQYSDGLIIATPTGSTAYSLSAGGPIITPTINAILIIALLPHSLSSRPIVIDNNSTIQLKFIQNNYKLKMSYDNHSTLSLNHEDIVYIKRSNYHLNLIHPKNFNYFKILNTKLGWEKKYLK